MARPGLINYLKPTVCHGIEIKMNKRIIENWFEQAWYRGNIVYSWSADYKGYSFQIDVGGLAIVYKFGNIPKRYSWIKIEYDNSYIINRVGRDGIRAIPMTYASPEQVKTEVVNWFRENKIADLMPKLILWLGPAY